MSPARHAPWRRLLASIVAVGALLAAAQPVAADRGAAVHVFAPGSVVPIDRDPPPPPAPVSQAAPIHAVDAALDRELAAALARAQGHAWVRGLSVAVLSDEGWSWAGAVGRDTLNQPLTAGTPLLVGSVTKSLVAGLIVRLAGDGVLDLDAPVTSLVPEAARIAPGATLRQMLTHTSGIADLWHPTKARLSAEPNRPWSVDELLASVPSPWFHPGAGYAYSNTNYYLLGLAAERASGRPVAELFDEVLAEPLGLEQTRLLDATTAAEAHVAPGWATAFWTSGAGVSTPAELTRWSRALFSATYTDADALAEMLAMGEDDYGMGIQAMELNGSTAHGHSGLLLACTALLLHFPEQGVSVALVATTAQADLAGALVARVNGAPSLLDLAERVAALPAP